MAILYKTRKQLLENSMKIVKRQYGGKVPFYASFQVQQAQQAPYNPMALLGRYQGQAPVKSAPSKGGAVEKRKMPEVKGLPNDAAIIADSMMGAEMELDQFIMGGGDLNSHAGKYLQNQADLASSLYLNDAAHRQEEWNQAQSIMRERTSEGAPMFDGSRFVAVRAVQDEDGNWRKEYGKVKPDELHDEESGWQALSYGKVHELLATSPDDFFTFLGKGQNLTTELAQGMGMSYIEDNFMKPNYDRIGETANAWKESMGGDTDEMGNVLKNFMRGESEASNEGQLKAALSKLRTHLSKPAMDALRGKFWLNSRSEEEVQNKIDQFFAKHMAQQLNISVETESADMWDPVDLEDLGGGSGGGGRTPVKAMGVYLQEAMGGGEPIWVGKELKRGKSGKTSIKSIPTWSAPKTTELLNHKEVLSSNDGFRVAGDIERAQSPGGRMLNQINVTAFDKKYKFADIAIPSKSSTVKVSYLPMKGGKVWHAATATIENMNKEIQAIEKKRDAEGDLAQPGNPMWRAYEEDIEAVKKKYMETDEMKGITMKPYYLVDVVYWKKAATSLKSMDQSYISEDDLEVYRKKFSDAYDASSSWQWDDEIQKKDLGKTTIMVPINDYADLQQIDKDIYTSQPNVEAGNMMANEAGRYTPLTNEQIFQSIKQDPIGQDIDGKNVYRSIYMTQYLNQ